MSNALKILWYASDKTGKKPKNGRPLVDIFKMMDSYHPEVIFEEYGRGKTGDVLLGINKLPERLPGGMRIVMYMGSLPTFLRSKSNKRQPSYYNKIDHVFFISEFYRRIVESKWKFRDSSVFLPFGPMPSDMDMTPISSRSIEEPYRFVTIAKWGKRKYKRLRQTLKFFNRYILKKYPNSYIHIVGADREDEYGRIIYHMRDYISTSPVEVVKKCHIQLVLTPFDTGPHTITESLHYRIPFVCTNNCSGAEYIKRIGSCGIVVKTDHHIKTFGEYKKCGPLNKKGFYDRELDYLSLMKAVDNIIGNYEVYTGWEQSKFDYKSQCDKLYRIFSG